MTTLRPTRPAAAEDAPNPGPKHPGGPPGRERQAGTPNPAGSERLPECPLRLTILDDNPFVRTHDGSVHPRAATFHHFAEAVVRCGPFAPARYLVPVAPLRPGEADPRLRAVDEQWLTVLPTRPFHGVAGYLARLPRMSRANWPVIRTAVAEADLVWIKAPASNALLAAAACRVEGVPRFTYVAGSARAVVGGQRRRGPGRLPATGAALAYDAVTRLLCATGPGLELDADLFTSSLSLEDVSATTPEADPPGPGEPWRIAWAGRMAGEKGLDDLFLAMADLRRAGRSMELILIGDGPDRARLEARAAQLGLADTIRWLGYIGDRGAYFAALREAHLFCFPSHAEGVPKVLVEAMAAGLPVIATDVGAVRGLLAQGRRGRLVPAGDPQTLTVELAAMMDDELTRQALRQRGLSWAADRTSEAQALRLVAWMRRAFPALPWPGLAGLPPGSNAAGDSLGDPSEAAA